jgi:hypothetical protein
MAIQTNIVWNRVVTQEEKTKMNNQILIAISARLTTDLMHTGGPSNSTNPTVRVWATVDAANEWIVLANSFTPPPVSATVTVG